MHRYLLVFISFYCLELDAQLTPDFNVEFQSQIQEAFPDSTEDRYRCFNDIWGYTAPDGSEYAILGACWATLIYDITDPQSPNLVADIPGTTSIWRDMKTYEEYAYVVADEGSDGILIIDMRNLPNSVEHKFINPTVSINNTSGRINTCHNLYIHDGIMMLAGCQPINNGGILLFDLTADPLNPRLMGGGPDTYAHDVAAAGDKMYTSDVFDGVFSIVDINSLTNPTFLNSQTTGRNFTHNAWPSADGNLLFTTDERSNAFVEAYDISNPLNIEFLDAYQPLLSTDRNIIPHNVHWRDSFLIISYYTEGIKIVDAHRPSNLIEVGAYDTYTFRYDGFNGCWGAFPFFESGLILGSDRSTGLWIFKPTYDRASYLEGLIINAQTSEPITTGEIKINTQLPAEATTDLRGSFQTGLGASGMFEVTYTAPGFESQKLSYDFVSGEVIFDTIALSPFTDRTVTGFIKSVADNSAIANAQIAFFDDDEEYIAFTNDEGFYSLTVPNQTYQITAGKWGFLYGNGIYNPDGPEQIEDILLGNGYADNFFFDFEWQVSGSAPDSRNWGIGIPLGTWYNNLFVSPNEDIPTDIGERIMTTGGSTDRLGNNLQDTGILKAPTPIDASTFDNPILAFSFWYQVQGVFENDDILEIRLIQNGEQISLLSDPPIESAWIEYAFALSDLIDITQPFEFEILGIDQLNPHIYEAAIDGFSVTDGLFVDTDQKDISSSIKIWPNPASDYLQVDISPDTYGANLSFRIFDQNGMLVNRNDLAGSKINIEQLPAGIYNLELYNFSNKIVNSNQFIKY